MAALTVGYTEPRKINIRIEGATTLFDEAYNYGMFWAVLTIGTGLALVRDIIRRKNRSFIYVFNKEISYYHFLRGEFYVLTASLSITLGWLKPEYGYSAGSAVFFATLLFGITLLRDYIVYRRIK